MSKHTPNPFILEEGIQSQSVEISSKDAQFLETRRFQDDLRHTKGGVGVSELSAEQIAEWLGKCSLHKIEIAIARVQKGWAVTVTGLLPKPEPVTQGRLTYKHFLFPTAVDAAHFLKKVLCSEGGGGC